MPLKRRRWRLGLVPEILNPIDMIFLIRKQLRMIDAVMMKRANIQGIVGFEGVGVFLQFVLRFARGGGADGQAEIGGGGLGDSAEVDGEFAVVGGADHDGCGGRVTDHDRYRNVAASAGPAAMPGSFTWFTTSPSIRKATSTRPR